MESVRIIYSRRENIAYCMWKYFFDSCGIWVISQTIEDFQTQTENMNNEETQRPTLYILSENEEQFISDKEQKEVVYYVSEDLWSKYLNQKRRDIIPIIWEKKDRVAVCKYLIQRLTDDLNTEFCLMEMMEYFDKYELWGNVWLFQAINEGSVVWDNQVYNACQKYLTQLKKMKDSYIENRYWNFSFIYYNYISDSIKDKNENTQIENIAVLLHMCKKHLKEYGDSSALYWLMGKICGLNSSERRTAVLFYESIQQQDYTPELLYTIGREYEKNYRDKKSAYSYYLKSYQMDKNYKALYKLAVRFNEQNDWKNALALYEICLNQVRKAHQYDSITISDIEYEYKATLRIAEIYKTFIKAVDISDEAKRYLQHTYVDLDNRKDFNELFSKMFSKNTLKLICEIWKKVKEKFQKPCFSNTVL